jgi:hypothetical protein
MRRLWILVVLVPGCLPAGADMGGTIAIGEDMVPDPAYRPRIGDRAVLYALQDGSALDRLPMLKDLTAYDVFVRSQENRDGERLLELEEQGWLHWAPPGTRVSVIAVQDRNHTGAHTATQIRITEGGYKNQTFWLPSDYVTRLIHKEPE